MGMLPYVAEDDRVMDKRILAAKVEIERIY